MNYVKFSDTLRNIDKDICKLLGKKEDREEFCIINEMVGNWYSSVALCLSIGKTFNEVREIYSKYPDVIMVIDYIEKNYSHTTWRERIS